MSQFSGDDVHDTHMGSVDLLLGERSSMPDNSKGISNPKVFLTDKLQLYTNSCLLSMPISTDALDMNDGPSLKTPSSQSSSRLTSLSSTLSSSLSSPRTASTRTSNMDDFEGEKRESTDNDHSMSPSRDSSYLPTQQQYQDGGYTASCLVTSSLLCPSPSFTNHHPGDMELTRKVCESSCNNRNSRRRHLQDGCRQPEVRIPGSGWNRLLLLTLGVLAMAHSGVHSLPIEGQSDTEQAYRKLQESTVKYLAQFGYLKGPSRETQNLSNQQDLTRAIKALQKAGNIPQTGVPDRRTEELMATPRCGNTDDFVPHSTVYQSPYSYTMGGEPHSRKKRYTLATSKWQRTNLTFRFQTYTKHMPRDQTRHLISEAFRVWSDHTPLSFKEVRHNKPDINILFASKYHSDGYPFDGPGMVLGHAFFPGRGKGGDTHFDDDEQWSSNSSSDGVDLFMVAAHEFGHSLGLAHSGDPSALMYPWYMGFDGKFRLPDDDYRGITSLYGSGTRDTRLPDKNKVALIPQSNDPDEHDPSIDEPPEEPKVKDESEVAPDFCHSPIDTISMIRSETFFFIGKWSYRMKKNGEKEIVEIHQFWQGFPKELDHIDAAVELPQPDNRILFFSGKRYWVFDSNSIAKGTSSEGRPITDFNIPDDVKKIDAAFVWGYNLRTYLVSGDMYWKMDERNMFVEYDYPRDMGTWRGVPVPLDSAFQDANGKTLFFQGLKYWEFYDLRMRVRRGSRLISQWFRCPKEETEEFKINNPPYISSGTNSQPGDVAEHKLDKDKQSKDTASSTKNISLVLLFVIGFVHNLNLVLRYQ